MNHEDDQKTFGSEFWDERYRSAHQLWSGKPNPQLVAEAAALPAGRALDAGCGEGADAIWLAQRGWEVVACDISGVALERGAQHAQDTDADAAERIEWRHVDMVEDPPEQDAFDLVSAQFLHLPAEARSRLFHSLADAVRRGGTLLIVGHDPSDLDTGVRRPRAPGVLFTADEVAALLDSEWQVEVAEARPRSAATP